ncbi:MAG: AAA family ATPase [Proteobacteria bacterium]|nr:AAA family ATPase [Pseudomonadota bacterium]
MNYFEILDLRMEPFSNSPDPDFLYRSQGHERCLHSLEIALRLRRGLSVVLGEVGTGKTTLCRELIRSLEEDESVTARLLLDPGFSSAHELLVVLHEIFCGPVAGDPSDWQLKERIKDTILTAGLDQEKILVLVVDEGQKMPSHCLEILRELLNYETNERKLLQIVLFAQSEFRQTLAAMPNLADRVNDLIRLEPLSLSETKAMVRHRLDTAKADYRAPELFTALGYLVLHRITGGYPRRIVRLCHKVVLGLIMRQRRKAGWKLVRACARENEMYSQPGQHSLSLAACLVCLMFLAWPSSLNPVPQAVPSSPANTVHLSSLAAPITELPQRPAPVTVSPQRPTPNPETVQVVSPASDQASADTPPSFTAQPPSILGEVKVQVGESISLLTRMIYGSFNRNTLGAVLDANPEVENPDRLNVGDSIRFPLAGMGFQQAWWVPLAEARTLAGAVAHWRTAPAVRDPRILFCRTDKQEPHFVVTAGGLHPSQDIARREAQANGHQTAPVSGWALVPPPKAGPDGTTVFHSPSQAVPNDAPALTLPVFLGKVDVQAGEDLPMLARTLYGNAKPQTLGALLAANPWLKNPDRLRVGDSIRFPPAGMVFQEAWWVPIIEARTLAGAVALWRAAPAMNETRILMRRDGLEDLRFVVIAGAPCQSEDEARREGAKAGVQTAPVRGIALISKIVRAKG